MEFWGFIYSKSTNVLDVLDVLDLLDILDILDLLDAALCNVHRYRQF